VTLEPNAARRDRAATAYVGLALAGALAIVAVEALLVVPGHLRAAQIAYALLVLAFVNAGPAHESRAPSPRALAAVGALRALALVPLIRALALALPMRDWTEPAAVLAVALPVGIVALRLAPVVGLPLRPLCRLRPPAIVLFAIAAGAQLSRVAFGAGAPQLWPDGAAGGRIALALAAAVVAACVEEIVFRGVVQGTLQRAAGRLGIVTACALFAATYLGSGSTALVLTFVLAGCVFALAVARSGALPGVIAGHVVLVVGAGAVWPHLLDASDLPALRGEVTAVVLVAAIVVTLAVACRGPLAAGRGAGGD
jgi:membrane protease YdiL (CAAX protease family)